MHDLASPSRSRRTTRLLRALSLAVSLTGLVTAPAIGQVCSGEAWRALRVLAQDSDLFADGERVGSVSGAATAGGCAVRQLYRIEGGSAEVLTWVDPATGAWQQVTVGSDGAVYGLAGTPRVTSGRLADARLEGTMTTPDGAVTDCRLTYSRNDAGDLREVVEVEKNGRWTTVVDITFGAPATPPPTTTAEPVDRQTERREATAERTPRPQPRKPVAAVPSEPEDEPNRVRVSSETRSAPTERRERVSKVEVDSPMLVELPLGPIEKLPDGYAWSSSDLALYEVAGATVERVEIKRRTRRGRTTLLVTLFGSSEGFSDQFDVTLQLLDPAGRELSGTASGRLFVGRSIGEQIETGTSKVAIDLEVEADTLAQALSGSDRPVLTIRLEAQD